MGITTILAVVVDLYSVPRMQCHILVMSHFFGPPRTHPVVVRTCIRNYSHKIGKHAPK